MNFLKATFLMIFLISLSAMASFNLNVKIDHMVGNRMVEVNKTIQADYDKEIVISPAGSKNKIVLNLKKFNNVSVNGNTVTPVQINMKLLNEMEKVVGRPQTITSFYDRSAKFEVRSSGILTDAADMNLSLHFDETN